MELWNKELENKAKDFSLHSQDGKGKRAQVLVKYFNPYGAGTWLITEAENKKTVIGCYSGTVIYSSGNGAMYYFRKFKIRKSMCLAVNSDLKEIYTYPTTLPLPI